MSVNSVACPYCNAQVPLSERIVTGQRMPCPRCGERFVYRGPDVETPAAPAIHETSFTPSNAPTLPPTWTGWSNRAIAGMILAVMATMAVIAMTFAEMTIHLRREHDTERPERRVPISVNVIAIPIPAHLLRLAYVLALIGYLVHSLGRAARRPSVGKSIGVGLLLLVLGSVALADLIAVTVKTSSLLGWSPTPPSTTASADAGSASVRAVPPVELEALGYLPKGTNVVAAIHISEALQTPAGREFLAHYQLGPIEVSLEKIERWTGLKADEIDHVALGLTVSDMIPPPLLLVIRTRRPYEEQDVLARLKANRRTEQNQKTLYRFKIEKPSLDLVLWCASPSTLVIGLTPKDLDAAPLMPATGAERLAPGVKEILSERLGAGSQAWLVGQIDQWDKIGPLLALFMPEQERGLFMKTRSFSSSLRFDPGMTLMVTIRCIDEPAALEMEKYFTKRKPEELPMLHVLGPRPEVQPIARELARSWKVERQGQDVTLTATASAELVRQTLEKAP